MKYFNDNQHDIKGYMKSLQRLVNRLDSETYHFMMYESFHDSVLNELTVFNKKETDRSKKSPVSVLALLTDWNNQQYELRWENVNIYLVDFDSNRNKIVGTEQVLFERGLDQWSHDELILTANNTLHHEIVLFSQTKITIQCEQFSIKYKS